MRSATAKKIDGIIIIKISIHALHAECDMSAKIATADYAISIHALHAECDGQGTTSLNA